MAGDPIRLIRARLASVRITLQDQASSSSFDAISRIQCDATIDAITKAAISCDTRAELMTICIGIPWADGDKHRLLTALKNSGTQLIMPTKRNTQDFTAFINYLTDSVWDRLLSDVDPSSVKLQLIIQVCMNVGVRCPSEKTTRMITSLWLLVTERPHALATIATSSVDKGWLVHVT